MTFKNAINSTKETLKKQAKNLALSTALIASLTACGPSDKKIETTTPTDSIKTEVVAKDSIQKVKSPVEKKQEGSQNNELEGLDEETIAMLKEADDILDEQRAEQKLQRTKDKRQEPWEKLGVNKEAYDSTIETYQEAEKTLTTLLNAPEGFRDEEGFAIAERALKEYHKMRKLLELPISAKAQKFINFYNKKKKEANK